MFNQIFQLLSASTKFNEDVLKEDVDSKLIPVDWTPDKGYVNESITRIALPRPAAGETIQYKTIAVPMLRCSYFLLSRTRRLREGQNFENV